MRLPLCLLLAISLHAETILIRNVTVHPVTAPDILNGSVLIVDGKIAEVGKAASHSGAHVIDGRGLHLYPGMINAATNVGLEEIESLRDTVDLDEIGLFNPALRAQRAFNPSSEHIEVTRASGITTVVSLPGSGERSTRPGSVTIIAGQGSLMHLNGWTWEEMAVKPSVVMDLLFPEIERVRPQLATFLGTQARTYADLEKEHKQQIRQLHEFFEQARHYEKAKNANPPGFERDLRLEAMLPVLDGKLPLFIRVGKEQTIKEAVQFADDEKIKVILADPIEIGSTGPLLKEKNIPVVLGVTLALPLRDDDPYDTPYTLANEFFKAGVKICFGTFDVQFARNVPFEAAQAVAFGLPHDEGLKALTINSAEILGAADQIGSIEKGKVADLILTDGDPLQATTTIRRMFISGQDVSLESRHTREYQKWLARP